jgi:hypothetical protein
MHSHIKACNAVLYLSLAIILMAACSGTIACDQTLVLPSRGTTAQAIEERFGAPPVIATEREEVERLVRALEECSEDDTRKVTSVWRYLKHRRNTLFIAFDRDLRVVCAGHRGSAIVVE